MASRARERVALAGFVVLMAVGALVLLGYIVVGHSWNMAASAVDDAIGSMEGYTVIVYPGTVSDDDIAAGAEAAEGGARGTAVDGDAAADDSGDDGGTAGAAGDGDAAVPENAEAAASSAGRAESAVSDVGSRDDAARGSASDASGSSAHGAEGLFDAFSPEGDRALVAKKEPARELPLPLRRFESYLYGLENRGVRVADVVRSYEDKGATTLVLDVADLRRYEEGMIIQRDGKRFGVFSITRFAERVSTQETVAWLASCGVDCIVALAPDLAHLEALRGVDVAVAASDDGLPDGGQMRGGTFLVDAVEEGKAGVVVLSPSGVPTAKVIAEI